MKKKILCIIPARGGSKRLKNKNILNFFGKPIINYTIKSAVSSKLFKKIIVSSDSIKIKKLITKNKIVFFSKRIKKLSNDKTSVNSVCLHVLKEEQKIGNYYDIVCCLYPNSPLRNKSDIINTANKLLKNKANFAIAITDYHFPVHQALVKKGKNLLPLWKNKINTQKLRTKFFVDNGSTYFAVVKNFLKKKTFYGDSLQGYYMKKTKSIDLNYAEDFKILKLFYKNKI